MRKPSRWPKLDRVTSGAPPENTHLLCKVNDHCTAGHQFGFDHTTKYIVDLYAVKLLNPV